MSQGVKLVQTLELGSVEDCKKVLAEFNKEHEKAQEIVFLSPDEKEKLWSAIFTRLEDRDVNVEIIADMLNSLRILCREKETLELVMTPERVKCLLEFAGLISETGPTNAENLCGMKVIFNMLFQSEKMQSMYVAEGLLKYLIQHVDPAKEGIPHENFYFLLRTFFIITALSKSAGATVRNDLNGIEVLVRFMDKVGNAVYPWDNNRVDILSESLKIMYNIIHDIFPKCTDLRADMFDSKDFNLLSEVCRLARRHILSDVMSMEKKLELSSHSIHLLCALPPECYIELLNTDFGDVHEPLLQDNVDMAGVEAIVKVADVKLDAVDKAPATPILLALSKMATGNRRIRKYLKKRILPPLTKTNLMERPEVGTSLRNKLCSVIHTPAGYLTEVAANLIFVLCKENVNKMVKYTGYGNAAGLLANRGLMLGGRGDGTYSDTSDESETEDYLEIKNEINYVEGRIKAEEPPIEMTEEQKEYEAMKLVEAIDKLSTSKLIQPCRIGEDGKPQPIENLLELQDALDNPIKNARMGSDSDSD